MHTIRLFKENVYKKEAEAVITSLSWQEGKFILTLDQTIFFPEGGGQTCDLGTIAGFEVSDVSERDVIVVDPMFATGGSASAACTFLKQHGCRHIKLMCIIGAPPAWEKMQKDHPDVDVYVAAMDPILNDHGYIVPGLGDAGDRIFGTK